MAKTRAIFVEGTREFTDRVIDWDPSKGPDYYHSDSVQLSLDPSPTPYAKTLIVPVRVYEHLGLFDPVQGHTREDSPEIHLFGYKTAGLTMFSVDQFFQGPDHNTLVAWMRTIRDQDRALHMELVRLAGVGTWPGKAEHPPYVKLHEQLRFITDACDTRMKPYLYLYHRRTQGVAVKRVM